MQLGSKSAVPYDVSNRTTRKPYNMKKKPRKKITSYVKKDPVAYAQNAAARNQKIWDLKAAAKHY